MAGRWLAPMLGVLYLVAWLVISTNSFGVPHKAVIYGLFALMIAISARFPLLSLGLLVAVPVLQIIQVLYPPENTTWPTYFAGGIAAFFVGLRGTGATRYLALPVGAVASGLIAYCVVSGAMFNELARAAGASLGPRPLWAGFVAMSLTVFGLYSGAWALGVGFSFLSLRKVLKTAESRLEVADFELRLSRVRARIARDVHDALAHSLAIVVSQAEGAAAAQPARPDLAAESLQNIATVGRAALLEVRRLVEQIQEDEDLTSGKPTIDDIESLAERMRAVGMRVTIKETGSAVEIALSHEVAAYRIVQESLTNSLKHAGATSLVSVVLAWSAVGLEIRVTSRGDVPLTTALAGGRGVGLAGIKERARLTGGWANMDRTEDGAFVVTAFIPAGIPTEIEESARLDTMIGQDSSVG